jgi:hypothetical protein
VNTVLPVEKKIKLESSSSSSAPIGSGKFSKFILGNWETCNSMICHYFEISSDCPNGGHTVGICWSR